MVASKKCQDCLVFLKDKCIRRSLAWELPKGWEYSAPQKTLTRGFDVRESELLFNRDKTLTLSSIATISNLLTQVGRRNSLRANTEGFPAETLCWRRNSFYKTVCSLKNKYVSRALQLKVTNKRD